MPFIRRPLPLPLVLRRGDDRLVDLRGQPELATAQMDCWAAYLAGQAHALELPIIDTSDLDPEAVADRVDQLMGVDEGGET